MSLVPVVWSVRPARFFFSQLISGVVNPTARAKASKCKNVRFITLSL